MLQQEHGVKESKTYFSESSMNRQFSFDLHENSLIYRPDNGEEYGIPWKDILYIEDRSGDRVDIFVKGQEEIPIRYATDEFTRLLKKICLQLSQIRKESFYAQKFTLTSKYLLHMSFVISVLVLCLIGSLFAGKALFFVLLSLFIPLGIMIQRKPISLTLHNRSLTVRNLLSQKSIRYDEIQDIDFEVESNDYGSTLCILLHLKNRKKITIKKLNNIILFFIMLQIKLNET